MFMTAVVRSRNLRSRALWLGFFGLGAGLAVPPGGQAADPETAAVRPLRNVPKGQRDLPTTSARIFLGNVERKILLLEDLVRVHPKAIEERRELSSLLHLRGLYRDDPEEVQRGVDHLSECLRQAPDHGLLWLERAGQQLSLHRFREARADLERGRTLGGEPAMAARIEQELDWSAGQYEKAISSIRTAAAVRPTPETLARLARLEHDLGNFAAADRAFERAEDLVIDPDPLPVAWLNVQRGRHRLEVGDAERALLFFSEALARVPEYVAARESLAEALHRLGRDEEAIAQLEAIVAQNPRSDVVGELALLYRATGRQSEAEAFARRARKLHEELLVRFPEAMYWHAAEFFLSQDDRARALELLTLNLGVRSDSTAWTAHARALYELGRLGEAKQSIDRALSMPVVSEDLFSIASRIYTATGEEALGALFARRARELSVGPPT